MSNWGSDKDAPAVGELNVRKPSGRFKAVAKAYQGRALKVADWGPPKCGKTRRAGTYPKPIFFIDFEFGSAPTLMTCFPGKCVPTAESEAKYGPGLAEINIAEVAVVDESTDEVDPIATLIEAEECMKDLTSLQYGTIVWDSATIPWQHMGYWVEKTATVRSKRTGKMIQTEWQKANARHYRWWMKMLTMKGVNFVAIGQTKDTYSGPNVTGVDNEPRWQKQTPHLADNVFHSYKGDPIVDKEGEIYLPFYSEFTHSRFVIANNEILENMDYAVMVKFFEEKKGMKFENGVLQVPELGKLEQVPNTK